MFQPTPIFRMPETGSDVNSNSSSSCSYNICLAIGLARSSPGHVHQISGAIGSPLCATCSTYATKVLANAKKLGIALPLQSAGEAKKASIQYRAAPSRNFSFSRRVVTREDLSAAAKWDEATLQIAARALASLLDSSLRWLDCPLM